MIKKSFVSLAVICIFIFLLTPVSSARLIGASLLQPVVIAEIPTPGATSAFFGVNPNTNTIFMTGGHDQQLWVIDGQTNSIVKTIPLQGFSYGVGVNPYTNTIYVNVGSEIDYGKVCVIDGFTLEIISEIPMIVPLIPLGIAVNPITNKIYVANGGVGNEVGQSVTVIDGELSTIVDVIPLSGIPFEIDVNTKTNIAYVDLHWHDRVQVIDCFTNQIISTISVGNIPKLWAVNSQTNLVYVIDGSDPSVAVPDRVTIIDGATNLVKQQLPLDIGEGLAVNSLINHIYISDASNDQLYILNGGDNSIFSELQLGNYPSQIGVNEAAGRTYVYDVLSNTISVIEEQIGTLQILKFDDKNWNKIKDQTESILSGWEFNIKGPDNFVYTGVTDTLGLITITNLKPGLYTITETSRASSWVPTIGSYEQTVNVTIGRPVIIEFGNAVLEDVPTSSNLSTGIMIGGLAGIMALLVLRRRKSQKQA